MAKQKINWQAIDSAPFNRECLVKGPSGYRQHPIFVMLAHRDYERGEDWLDPEGESLSDGGLYPTHWADFDPE